MLKIHGHSYGISKGNICMPTIKKLNMHETLNQHTPLVMPSKLVLAQQHIKGIILPKSTMNDGRIASAINESTISESLIRAGIAERADLRDWFDIMIDQCPVNIKISSVKAAA